MAYAAQETRATFWHTAKPRETERPPDGAAPAPSVRSFKTNSQVPYVGWESGDPDCKLLAGFYVTCGLRLALIAHTATWRPGVAVSLLPIGTLIAPFASPTKQPNECQREVTKFTHYPTYLCIDHVEGRRAKD